MGNVVLMVYGLKTTLKLLVHILSEGPIGKISIFA